jgi:hypothetical protein
LPRTVEPRLFSLFRDLAPTLKELLTDDTFEDPSDFQKSVSRVYNGIDEFVTNFFVQVFNAFGISIDGVNEPTISVIEEHFERNDVETPDDLIDAYREYVSIQEDVEQEVYSGPLAFVVESYCDFLPGMFQAFRKECRTSVTNYLAVLDEMDPTSQLLREICALA